MTGFDAIVLAGGAARRMGGLDKPMQPVGGLPMLARVLAAVREAGRTVVVGPPRPGITGVIWTREDPPGGGPVAALAAGLPHTDADLVLVLAADLPWIAGAVPALLSALQDGQPGTDTAVLHRDGRDNYLAAAWHRAALLDRLARQPAAGAAMRGLYRDAVCVPVEDPAGWGRDVDTTEDLDELSG